MSKLQSKIVIVMRMIELVSEMNLKLILNGLSNIINGFRWIESKCPFEQRLRLLPSKGIFHSLSLRIDFRSIFNNVF